MKLNFQNTSRRTLRILFSSAFLLIFGFSVYNAVNFLYIKAVSNDQCAWRVINGRTDAYLVTDVVEGGVADIAGIKDGDILLKIDGVPIESNTRKAVDQVNKIPYGVYANYEIERNGKVFNVDVMIVKVFDVFFLARFLFGLVFLVMGYIVVQSRPEGVVQRYFAYIGMLLLLNGDNLKFIAIYLPGWLRLILFGGSFILFPIVFLNFVYLFPVRRKRKYYKLILYPFIVISVIGLGALAIQDSHPFMPDWLLLFLNNIGLISFGTGSVIFIDSYFRYVSPGQRKPLRPILYCQFVSLLGILYITVINAINTFLIFIKPVMLLPGLLIVALPLAYGYSIFKYRLMDMQFIIKKSLIYGLISAGIAIIYILLVFGIGNILKGALGENENEALSLFALVVIAFVFDPLKKRVQNSVDRLFYRERYDYQKALLDFSKILPLKLNVNQIMNSVVNTISSTMHVDKIAGVIINDGKPYSCFSRNLPEELCVYDYYPKGILDRLNKEKNPINVNNLVDQRSYNALSAEETHKLAGSGVHLIVPMVSNDRVTGYISAGSKLSEKMYSEEDIELLNTVASQAAIAIENARLHEKEKTLIEVQQEIKLASQIQSEWQPKESPDIPGFEVALKTIPAKVVGGDYLDFVKIDNDSFSLCIGDVSGKGLPAAMLMGYVQAILRSQALSLNDIKDCIKNVNRLVHDNSRNDMFVTLFYCTLNYKTGVINYINAGHNYPILLSGSGDVKYLFEGGLPLGIEENPVYEMGQVTVNKNDVLLMYTDGITETFNSAKNQFGEERLLKILECGRDLSCTALMHKIFGSIDEFRGDADIFDDSSVILLKCVK